MRSLESARESWRELQLYKTLPELKEAIRLESDTSLATTGLRSACWKAFLLFESVDVAEWQRTLAASRSAYNALRSHFFRYIDHPDSLAADLDPLNQDAESSPWSEVHRDEELRAEILQDVERIGIPSTSYFEQPDRQRMLLDILFIFCKLNPDVGYRQGMHEVAAPIFYVVENDAVDVGGISKTLGEDSIIKTVFDADYLEHDTFALFGQVMQSAKGFYISEGPVSIATRSQHIFNELLPKVDPDLMKHLQGLDIVPQVFLIRWIRLLFGREFEFESAMTLWDVMFAQDSSLEVVDYICLAMLLRIRWHLLDADYNNALALLLRYPEPDKDFPAQTLGLDAMYLRTHMTVEGGSYLVLKYTGRPLVVGRPTTPPALQRNITTFAIRHAVNPDRKSGLSPPRTPRQSRNIEGILQNTAKSLYAQGEKLGIGKAVRSAMDEVQKKAQEIRDAQTSSPPPWRGSSNVNLLNHAKQLELRNKRLSVLLSGAVSELWEYQKLITEGSSDSQDQTVEKLSAAIAKVQFVQVYLDEPSLSLSENELSQQTEAIPEGTLAISADEFKSTGEPQPAVDSLPVPSSITPPSLVMGSAAGDLADPSTFEDFSESSASLSTETKVDRPQIETTEKIQDISPRLDEPSPIEKTPRPTLEQSPFSFMLGQGAGEDSKGKTNIATPSRGSKGIALFGYHERSPSASARLATEKAEDPLNPEGDQDEFDMRSLRRAKGTRK